MTNQNINVLGIENLKSSKVMRLKAAHTSVLTNHIKKCLPEFHTRFAILTSILMQIEY